jgi:hypothetical protein
MNVEFLLVIYFISLSVDWIFQWQWQALNKSRWGKGYFKPYSLLALTTHSFVYAFLSTWITSILLGTDSAQNTMVFWVLSISHMVIDSRIPVKWIMRFKGMTKEEINDPAMGFMHIGIDHRLHELVLLALAFIV